MSRKWHLIILITLSLLYLGVNGQVNIHGFIGGSQFDLSNFTDKMKVIHNVDYGLYKFFVAAFILDFIWATFLITYLFRLITQVWNQPDKGGAFFGIAVVALLFDWTENTMYLLEKPFLPIPLSDIMNYKMIAYGVALIILLYHFIYYLVVYRKVRTMAFFKLLYLFIKRSYISLLIILLIFGLLTQMDQGSTIIVDLLYRPLNLGFFYVYLFFMAIVLSHFPTFIEAFRVKDQSKIVWCINRFILPVKWTGFGLVHFIDKRSANNYSPNNLRYFIGLGLFSSFLYVLLFVADRFEMIPMVKGYWAIIVFGLSIWIYNKARKRGWVRYYQKVKWITFIAIVINSLLSAFYNWSVITLTSCIFTLLIVTFYYILFRINRKKLFGDNELQFVKIIAIGGMISLLPLIITNLWVDVMLNYVNPILILFLYIVNFYGVIIIIAKHIYFYYDNEQCEGSQQIHSRFKHYKYLIPTMVITLLIWVFISPKMESDLHRLQTYNPPEQLITLNDYLTHIESSEDFSTYFQVASYGGGLKANLWTLLVLNKLQKKTQGKFINQTLSMSGTSGGMLGLGNYAALWAYNTRDPSSDSADELWDDIEHIGKFNHLLIDMTYLLGYDLIREWIPLKEGHLGMDRSYKSMVHYGEMTGIPSSENTFRGVWSEIYNKSKYFPPLIVNTYATSGRQGVGISLDSAISFPGAINIIDFPDNKLQVSYQSALSTSNRFPIFSPTANIKGKGHFLDGGYFDNSGLSSSIYFKQKVISTLLPGNETVHVIINNSKTDYIKAVFDTLMQDFEMQENTVGELTAIINGITGLDKVPSYFEGVLKSKDPVHLYLPHPISYEDVVSTYDGDPKIDPAIIAVVLINENKKIRDALKSYESYLNKWGVVSPALARLNSEPAVRYQQAMMFNHVDISLSVNRIYELSNSQDNSESNFVVTDLYFGLSSPDGDISEVEWLSFRDSVIINHFSGFTEINANGAWLDPTSNAVLTEDSKIVRYIHPNSKKEEDKIEKVISIYKEKFKQQSVLRVDSYDDKVKFR